MARKLILEPSRTLAEFRLLPGLTTAACSMERISLRTPLVNRPSGGEPIFLNIPLVSAAMQSVSGVAMGIGLARQGGVAFIYASQPADQQAMMVSKIKHHKAGFVKPQTILPNLKIRELGALKEKSNFSTFPVVDENGTLLGLISKNDYDPSRHAALEVRERMIPRSALVVGIDINSLKQANELLIESHHGVLPIVDGQNRLLYLVFRKDIYNHLDNPLEVVDRDKRLLAAAAINTRDYRERVPQLVDAEADILLVDSSDGHSEFQREAIEWTAKRYPEIPIIGGNIITGEGFLFMVEAGAQAVKVGMGGGSICITQEQKGTGRGLASAIIEVAEARDRFHKDTGRYIPIIADGGITHAKDISLALALGADSIMMGRYFARMEESPTEKVLINNRVMKPYWGEGSPRAREWRNIRYQQDKFFEGVEGYVEFAGKLEDNLGESLAKIKATLCSCGAATIGELQANAAVELVSGLSIREGQVHDIFLPGLDSPYHARAWGGY